jgi:hypothetical protein
MPNIVVNGFGYRRTGTVNRPNITVVKELEVDLVQPFVLELEVDEEVTTDFTIDFREGPL